MKKQLQSGFTLIELMIAIMILSFIGLAIYQNTAQSFVLRDNLERDGDFYNGIRVALDIFGRDVQHIFTPQEAALPGNLGKPEKQGPGGTTFTSGSYNNSSYGTPLAFWGEPINQHGVRPTRLKGDFSQISFISNSHLRLFRDSQESEFAKIKHSIEDDKLIQNKDRKTFVKHENLDVFGDVERPESDVRYVLLNDVKSIKFRFLDGEKDRWDDKWDTTGTDHKNVFPSVIEITLEVFLPNSTNTFIVSQRFRPELPL